VSEPIPRRGAYATLHGTIEWPGPDEVPDLRRRPLCAAIAALHATTRAVIYGVMSVHPDLESDRRKGNFAARGVVLAGEQLLAAIDVYISYTPAPRTRALRTPTKPHRWVQLALPLRHGEPTAIDHARRPADLRAR